MIRLPRRALIVGAATLALLPWTLASAQDMQQNDRPPQAQQQKPLAKLMQSLNLTPQQKKQWLQINRETNQKVWAVRRDDSLNEAQMQAQIKEIHRQHNQQLLAMLSPEQQDSLNRFWDEQKQKQQDKAADNNSGPNPTAPANNNQVKEDDALFAGMVSDDPAPAQPQQPSKKAPK